MKTLIYVLVPVLWLVVGLFAYRSSGDVVAGFEAAGWGVLVLPLWYMLPVAVFTFAWRRLLKGCAPSFPVLFRGTIVGSATNWLLPVAQVGGEVVRAWIAVRAGVPGRVASASVVVDKAAMSASHVVFALTGLSLLILLDGAGAPELGMLAGIAAIGLLTGVFVWLQRAGMAGFLARTARPFVSPERLERLAGGADAVDAAVVEIHGTPGALIGAIAIRLVGWSLVAGEIWIAMRLLGRPIDVGHALLIESLGQAARVVAFFVPGALGVQEGWYMVIGATLGIGPAIGLELSLMKRVRELVIGVPALVLWPIRGRGCRRAPLGGADPL